MLEFIVGATGYFRRPIARSRRSALNNQSYAIARGTLSADRIAGTLDRQPWRKNTEAIIFALDAALMVIFIYWAMNADDKAEDSVTGLFAWREVSKTSQGRRPTRPDPKNRDQRKGRR